MIGSDYETEKVHHPAKTLKFILQMYDCPFLEHFITNEYEKWKSAPSKLNDALFLSKLFHEPYTENISDIVNMLIVAVANLKPDVFLIICGMLYWKWEFCCKYFGQQFLSCQKDQRFIFLTFAAANRHQNCQLFQKWCTILNSRRFEVQNLDKVWSYWKGDIMDHMLVPLWNRIVCYDLSDL